MYRRELWTEAAGLVMLSSRCRISQQASNGGFLIRPRRSLPTMMPNFTDNATDQNRSSEILDFGEEACTSVDFILDFFHDYYIPFIILLGLVGNLLSCIVFLNTHLKMRSSSYYLAALATADFGFLVALSFVWLNNSFGLRVFNKAGWCEILVYISAVCGSLSVWLIVAFTVERFIAVQYPLHRPQMCTISRAKTIVLVLVVLALIGNLYAFVTAGIIITPEGFELCDLNTDYWAAMRVITVIDSMASLIFPFFLIVVMNTMITRNLLQFSKQLKCSPEASAQCTNRNRSDINLNQIPNGSNSHDGAENIPLGTIGGQRTPSFHSSKNNSSSSHSQQQPPNALPGPSAPRKVPKNAAQCIHIRSSSRNSVSRRNQKSITKMLLLISTTFILLNLPSYVLRFCVFSFTLAGKDIPVLLWCLQQFFMLLYWTNFSINFLLYAMCGITFRQCLEQLLRKGMKNITRYCERERRNSDSS